MKKTITTILAVIMIATLIPTVAFASSTATFDNTVTISNVTSQVNGAVDDWRADHYNMYRQVDKSSLKTIHAASPVVVSVAPDTPVSSVSIVERNRYGSVININIDSREYSTTLTDGQYFVEVNYPSSSTTASRRAIFYLNVGNAQVREPRFVNDNHPTASNLANYSDFQVEALEQTRPELREWVYLRLGSKNSGCYDTAKQFAIDVFGIAPPIESENGYYKDYEVYYDIWTFIPYTRGMVLEAGDIVIEYGSNHTTNPGHVSVMLGEYMTRESGTRLFVVVESDGRARDAGIFLGTFGISADGGTFNYNSIRFAGVLRPDWSQSKQNRPAANAPNIETASAWARDSLNTAYRRDIIHHALLDTYTANITRAEFCMLAMAWIRNVTGTTIEETSKLVADYGIPERSAMLYPFNDTYHDDVIAAYRLGIVGGTTAPTGTTQGKFSPNNSITRQEAAVMLANLCRVFSLGNQSPPTADFQDMNTAAGWAHSGINFVRANGIMSGTSTTPPLFSPLATYTREQAIITFNNLFSAFDKPDWAYRWY